MAIENGYITLAEFLAEALPKAGTDETNDTVIENIIEESSRFIDTETLRFFYAKTDTLEFDVPSERQLRLKADLISVTTLTNGDGTAISASDFILLPSNATPKYAIKLKQSSSVFWTSDSDGNTEQVITVLGSWGWSATVDPAIRRACMDIAVRTYRRRYGNAQQQGQVTVTAAGVIITPQDVPQQARRTINAFRRRV